MDECHLSNITKLGVRAGRKNKNHLFEEERVLNTQTEKG
jgi:hypothetical protein